MAELRQSEIPIPDSFCCPITKDIMQDPVCTCDGHTYERRAIQVWLQRHDISPNTGLRLLSRTLTPNFGLKKAINAFLEQRPEIEKTNLQQKDLELAAQLNESEVSGKVELQKKYIETLFRYIESLQGQIRDLGAEPLRPPSDIFMGGAGGEEAPASERQRGTAEGSMAAPEERSKVMQSVSKAVLSCCGQSLGSPVKADGSRPTTAAEETRVTSPRPAGSTSAASSPAADAPATGTSAGSGPLSGASASASAGYPSSSAAAHSAPPPPPPPPVDTSATSRASSAAVEAVSPRALGANAGAANAGAPSAASSNVDQLVEAMQCSRMEAEHALQHAGSLEGAFELLLGGAASGAGGSSRHTETSDANAVSPELLAAAVGAPLSSGRGQDADGSMRRHSEGEQSEQLRWQQRQEVQQEISRMQQALSIFNDNPALRDSDAALEMRMAIERLQQRLR